MKRSKGSQVWFDIKNVKSGKIGPSKLYIVWWFGPRSQFIGFQIGDFRINVHHDDWKTLPKTFHRL